jgi:hypothetical protein
VTLVDIEKFQGGDGQGTMADPEDWTTVYSLGHGGSLTRTDLRTRTSEKWIDPVSQLLPEGRSHGYTNPCTHEAYLKRDLRLRANPHAPLLISPWDSKTLYFGANYLFKSVDRGDNWKIISPDLTHDKLEWQIPETELHLMNRKCGVTWYFNVYQAIRTISESPLKRGMIWVGTDDGYVWLTMDDGARWTNVTKSIPGLPEFSWISHIYASRFSEGRAYLTVDNHRNVDLNTYVYVTEDYGETWARINGNLPERESCYVIKEGLKNPDLLFLGTEFSLWVSLDRGRSWSRYQDWNLDTKGLNQRHVGSTKGYFPNVAIYDLAIHPRELDLIIGTHGRSIWTLPVRALEELTAENREKEVYFVTPGNVYLLSARRIPELPGGFFPNTQPGTLFSYHLKRGGGSEASIAITDPSGQEVYAMLPGTVHAGLNVVPWNHFNGQFPIRQPGDYRAVLTIDGKEYARTLHVEDVSDEDCLAGQPREYPANRLHSPPPAGMGGGARP